MTEITVYSTFRIMSLMENLGAQYPFPFRWGRIGRHEDSPHSNVLQAATVPVVSDWECFEMTGLLNYEDQVCAGGVGAEASACPGDSGGALQVSQLIH